MAETPGAPGPCRVSYVTRLQRARRSPAGVHVAYPLPHLRLLTLLHSPSLSSIGRLWKAREVPMGRRAKPAKAEGKAKLPVARKSRKNDGHRVRDLETRLAGAVKREAEALERQTATAEILRAMSCSPKDFQPVFDAIVRNGARLCDAVDAVLILADGDEFVDQAHHGPMETLLGGRYPLRGAVGGRAVLEARVIQVEDLSEAADYPVGQAMARRAGYRPTLSVPLLRGGGALRGITIPRTEVMRILPRFRRHWDSIMSSTPRRRRVKSSRSRNATARRCSRACSCAPAARGRPGVGIGSRARHRSSASGRTPPCARCPGPPAGGSC